MSAYRACTSVSPAHATFRYQAHPEQDSELVSCFRALASRYPRYGYRRITALLRQNEVVNQKRVRRVWRHHRLHVKRVRRSRQRRSYAGRLQATHPGHIWAYDCIEDALATGTPFKVLTVMDECTREGLTLNVTLTTSADRVIGVLITLFAQYGGPAYVRSDNGAEFISQSVQLWLHDSGVETLYIEPGKPWQNGKEERFNGTVRDECVNRFVFGSVVEACVRLNSYRHEYNTERPHSSLGYRTPQAFHAAWAEAQQKQPDPLTPT